MRMKVRVLGLTRNRLLAISRQSPPRRWVNIIWSRVIKSIWRKNNSIKLPKNSMMMTEVLWPAVTFKSQTMTPESNSRRSWVASAWAESARTTRNRCTWSKAAWRTLNLSKMNNRRTTPTHWKTGWKASAKVSISITTITTSAHSSPIMHPKTNKRP